MPLNAIFCYLFQQKLDMLHNMLRIKSVGGVAWQKLVKTTY